MKHTMQLELAAKILVVVTVFGFISLLAYHLGSISPITGNAVLNDPISQEGVHDTHSLEETSNTDNSFIELSAGNTPNTTQNTSNQTFILSGRGRSRNSNQQPNVFTFTGFPNNGSLRYQGTEVTFQDQFQGRVRFMLFMHDIQTAEFDVIFNGNVDLSTLEVGNSIDEKKAFFFKTNEPVTQIDLFVPRNEEDFLLRTCANVTNLNDIHDSCSDTLTLNDSDLSVTSDGEFFRIQNIGSIGARSEEVEPQAEITLLSPPATIPTNNSNVTFAYLLHGEKEIDSCSLVLDNQELYSWENPSLDTVHSFVKNGIGTGKHSWFISCESLDESMTSQINDLTVFSAERFGGRTTDLTKVSDLTNVTNFTIEGIGKGLIRFDESLDLSDGFDLDSFITIEHNFIRINSEMLPQLNKSATLTFFDLGLENVIILRDGEVCTDCVILENNGDLTFKVPHFSSYTAVLNAQLEIFDSTESQTAEPNEQVIFYANFSNFTSNAPISGGGSYCNITLPDDSTTNMVYNATSGLYEYNTSFANQGTYLFDVSCFGTPLGFADITLNDTFSILSSTDIGLNGATITAATPETAPTDPADSEEAMAGNVTGLTISGYSTTQSWQGFYGNVSGTIELTDGSDNTFYNWSYVEPEGEVYASTTSEISWSNIQCFNFTAAGVYGNEEGSGGATNQNGTNLAIFESQLNIESDDIDGINETFAEQNHDAFYTGSSAFSEDECRSTHIFTQSGAVDGTFQEVLLYEPISSAVVFAALLEKPQTSGFNGAEYSFQMIVPEDGHSGDTASTTYYFWIELG